MGTFKEQAIPLEESLQDAVRKIPDAAEEHCKHSQTHIIERHGSAKTTRRVGSRLPKEQKAPQSAYYQTLSLKLQR